MILHIITGLGVGGAEQSLRKLLLSGVIPKDKIAVVSLTDIGSIGRDIEKSGVKVFSLGITGFCSLPLAFYKLIKLIKLIKPDLVQTWLYHADLIGGLAAKLAGINTIIWSVRTTEIKESANLTIFIRRTLAVLSYIVPSKVVCVANASQNKHAQLGFCSRKLLVIENGYDVEDYAFNKESRVSFREEIGVTKETVIGLVARFDEDKGIDLFIKAASLVVEYFPEVKFLMIGKELTNGNPRLSALLNDEKLKGKFILLGQRKDIPYCLSGMDIFCLPSRTEGFPNALAEAMSSALPCVSSEVGDVRCLLSESGILVKPNDYQDLANGIVKMLRLPRDLRQAYGEKSKVRISEHYSMSVTQAKYKALYVQLTRKDQL